MLHDIEPNEPSVLGISFLLSLAINVGVFVAMSHQTGSLEQARTAESMRQMQLQKAKNIQFEFVESPIKTRPERPQKTKKISDRDSLAQDALLKKNRRSPAPHIRQRGRSDQLSQVKGAAARPAVAAEPVQVPPPKPPAPETQPAQKAPEPQPLQKIPQPQPEPPETVSAKTELVEKPAPKVVDEVKPPAQPEKPADQKTQQQQERPQSKPPQEASKPQGLTGQDKISTQLMARTRSFGALLEGMTSFEASGTQMGAYMKNVKERVWLSWFPYLAFQYPQDYRSADAVIGFTLDRKGNVKSVQILENYGSPLFAAFCVDAVQKASGFGPVPDEILALTGQDQIDIRFGFHYR